MRFALSTDQLTEAVVAYLRSHNYELPVGSHEVDIPIKEGKVTLSFERLPDAKQEST